MPPRLVTIAIPTFNRQFRRSPRALDSALAQTHTDLEVIVVDDASSDGTEDICRAYTSRDERVQYVRHRSNLGPTATFNELFLAGRAPFTQLLADDDWLDPQYVATCVSELDARSDHSIVGGRASYWRGEQHVSAGVATQLAHERGADRTLAYFRTVEDNGSLYGLLRTSALRRVGPMPNVLGNDLVLSGRSPFKARLRRLHRFPSIARPAVRARTLRRSFALSAAVAGRSTCRI